MGLLRLISIISTLFFFAFCNEVAAQNKKPVRAEIETKVDANPFNIVNTGSQGVIILNRLNEFLDRKTQNWSISRYNNILQKKWTKKIALNEDLSYQGFDLEEDSVYLFFHKENKKSSDNNLTIIAFDTEKGGSNISSLLISEKSRLTTLKVFNRTAYFTSESKTNIYLNIYDFRKRLNNELIINEASDVNVENLKIDTVNNKIYVVFKKEISRKENKLFLSTYNLNGNKLSSADIAVNDETKKILTASIVLLHDGNIGITGSYNLSSEKANVYTETSVLEAAGMYYVKIEKNKVNAFQFYNFLIFPDINKYLNKREISKIRKIQESKDQKEYSLNYMLVEHDVLQTNGKLLLVSEAFYPEYRTISDMSYDYYGRMVPTSRTIFDGFRYTNAFILCLDEDGKILWNNLFDIWNILTMEVKERVSIMPLKDEYVFSYNNDGEIVYKSINDTITLSEIDNTKIELTYPNDKIMENPSANIDYWYNNYFLCYGIQTVKNNALANKSKRTVFYINKISYE